VIVIQVPVAVLEVVLPVPVAENVTTKDLALPLLIALTVV